MAKRPSLLANIDMEKGQGSDADFKQVVEMPQTALNPGKSTPVKTSLYLPPEAHRKLKEIAFAKDCKMHDLVIDGVNRVLSENGYPTVKELAK
ncbi:MAG: hypothetical protein ACSHXZ_15090 [Gammaproteobacteria bacterium]